MSKVCCGPSTLVYGYICTYIARFSLIIYYHSLFYNLGHGTTIVVSYCDSDTIVAPQTIVQYDITIIAKWWQAILENTDWSIWYFESVCTNTEGHVTRNQPISFEYLHLTYNKYIYWSQYWCHILTNLFSCIHLS